MVAVATPERPPSRPATRHLRAVVPRAPLWLPLLRGLRALGRFVSGPVLVALARARDLLLHLAGFTLVAVGVGMVYRPAGFVVAGLLVLYLQALLSAPGGEA